MVNTTPALNNKTELKDRTLWYDGDSTVKEEEIVRMLSSGLPVDGIFVDSLTSDIVQYNNLVDESQQIKVKQRTDNLDFTWDIPEEYKQLDVVDYLHSALEKHAGNMSDSEWEERAYRVVSELMLYREHELEDVLRVLIYVINTLETNNVVWGVGRGSSVASYILYLIGVHDVDSVKYQLNISDFLHTETTTGE